MMMMMEMTIVIIIKLFLICWPKSMYANNMTDFEVKILGIDEKMKGMIQI